MRVQRTIERSRLSAIPPGRDDGLCSESFDVPDEAVAVVRAIGDHGGRAMTDETSRLRCAFRKFCGLGSGNSAASGLFVIVDS